MFKIRNPKFQIRDSRFKILGGQFVKYCAAGITATGSDFVILYLLVEHTHLFYFWAACLGIATGMITGFTINKYWTFQKPEGKYFIQLVQYSIAHSVGIGINLAILTLLVEVFGMWYILAKVFATAAAVIWNFLATKKWVFGK